MTNPSNFDAGLALDHLHETHQYEGEVAASIELSNFDYDQLAAIAQLTSSEPIDSQLSGDDLIEEIGLYLEMSAENDSE